MFWAIANATTETEFNKAVQNLQRKQSSAATYLLAIDQSMWVTAFIPGGPARRYGQ